MKDTLHTAQHEFDAKLHALQAEFSAREAAIRREYLDKVATIIGQKTRWFLKEWREHFGLSGEALAEKMGTTKSTISKLERSKSFKTEWIDRYCAALSVLANRQITAKDLATRPSEVLPPYGQEQKTQRARVSP